MDVQALEIQFETDEKKFITFDPDGSFKQSKQH